MAKKQVAQVMIHASEFQENLQDDNLDISVDYIDDGLYLGKTMLHCLVSSLQITR